MVLSAKNKLGIGLFVIVLAGGIVWGIQYQKQRAGALPHLTELVDQADADRKSLIELYQKRTEFLVSWEKAAEGALHGKLPAALVVSEPIKKDVSFVPKTEADFDHLDLIQNQVSEELTAYFQNPEAVKVKPQGLEKLEEEINRKRHHYHEVAFEANDLMDKYDGKRARVPVFTAEKTLLKSHLFK